MKSYTLELRVDGRIYVVAFKWADYGRTYISETQGGNRDSPRIEWIRLGGINGITIYEISRNGSIYSNCCSLALLQKCTESIQIWGYEITDQEIGDGPPDEMDSQDF